MASSHSANELCKKLAREKRMEKREVGKVDQPGPDDMVRVKNHFVMELL